jgi:hypothetical protein
MLILKMPALEPMHGYGISVRIEQMSKGVFKMNAGSLSGVPLNLITRLSTHETRTPPDNQEEHTLFRLAVNRRVGVRPAFCATVRHDDGFPLSEI